MHVSLLRDDYLSPAGQWKKILTGQRREAPAVFMHQGHYYLITTLCSGWDANAADCAVADSMLGDWHQQGNPCIGPDAAATFHSQSTYVLPLHPEQGSYLFMADRWNKTDLEPSHAPGCDLDLICVLSGAATPSLMRRCCSFPKKECLPMASGSTMSTVR